MPEYCSGCGCWMGTFGDGDPECLACWLCEDDGDADHADDLDGDDDE